MNNITVNLFKFRSVFITRYCPILQTNLSSCKRNFSDDAEKKNLYETLGIKPSATLSEIKKAYYDLTFKYHPDRNENSEKAAIKFREVTEAYEILGNYSLRKKYDTGIPISLMRKTIKPSTAPKAKYQEFFDSRFADRNQENNARAQEVHDLGAFSKNEEKIPLSGEHTTPVVQFTVLMFFLAIYFSYHH